MHHWPTATRLTHTKSLCHIHNVREQREKTVQLTWNDDLYLRRVVLRLEQVLVLGGRVVVYDDVDRQRRRTASFWTIGGTAQRTELRHVLATTIAFTRQSIGRRRLATHCTGHEVAYIRAGSVRTVEFFSHLTDVLNRFQQDTGVLGPADICWPASLDNWKPVQFSKDRFNVVQFTDSGDHPRRDVLNSLGLPNDAISDSNQ